MRVRNIDGRYWVPLGAVNTTPTVRLAIGTCGRSGTSWRRLVDRTRRPRSSPAASQSSSSLSSSSSEPIAPVSCSGSSVRCQPFGALLHPQPAGLLSAGRAHRFAGRAARQRHPADGSGLTVGDPPQLRTCTHPFRFGQLLGHDGGDPPNGGEHHDTSRSCWARSRSQPSRRNASCSIARNSSGASLTGQTATDREPGPRPPGRSPGIRP